MQQKRTLLPSGTVTPAHKFNSPILTLQLLSKLKEKKRDAHPVADTVRWALYETSTEAFVTSICASDVGFWVVRAQGGVCRGTAIFKKPTPILF